jgi:site-specific DNA-methyltransferase (adenine-specific)
MFCAHISVGSKQARFHIMTRLVSPETLERLLALPEADLRFALRRQTSTGQNAEEIGARRADLNTARQTLYDPRQADDALGSANAPCEMTTATKIAPIRQSAIYEGDALAILRRLPEAAFQCCITSPPYWGLRDYKIQGQIGLEETLPQYLTRLGAIFSEVKRVLRDDGILWLNIGDGYTSGNRGWRAPDKKNRARAMNVRPETPAGLKPKDLLGVPWRLAFALQDEGWYLRTDIIWNKPNAMPESVKDRPTRSHEYMFMFTKSEGYYYERTAILEENGRNKRTVWDVNTRAFPDAHFATFPPALIEPCMLASTASGDVVLDPFFGSGTVGLVAQELGRRYVGIELLPEYVDMAARRLQATETVIRAAA